MPDQLQLRGGTTVQHSTFTGASKEVTVDTTKKTVVVHDGSTAGGNPMLREDASNSALALGSAGTPSLKFTGDPNTGIYSPGADQVAISTNGTQRVTVDTAATTSTLPVVHPLGAVGTPSITFTGDLNTGFWSPAADTVAASTGGSERLRITSAGLVGVGTSSPNYLITANSSTAISALQFINSSTGSTASDGFLVYNNGLNAILSNEEAGDLRLQTGGQQRLTIDSSGRVGIGASSPGVILDIRETATGATTAISLFNTDNTNSTSQTARIGLSPDSRGAALTGLEAYKENSDFSTSAARDVSLALNVLLNNAKSEAVRITSAGLVGIGTSSPSNLLEIDAGSSASVFRLNSNNATYGVSTVFNYNGSFIGSIGSGKGIDSVLALTDFGINSATNIDLCTNYTRRVRIDSSGRVGIGTTAPSSNLHISSSGNAELRITSGAASQAILRFGNGVDETLGSIRFNSPDDSLQFYGLNDAERMRIDSSGRLLVGTSTNTGGSLFQVNDNRIRIATAKTPASATDTGSAGEICWDANYIYVCTATNTWKRAALSTW